MDDEKTFGVVKAAEVRRVYCKIADMHMAV